MSEGLLVWKPPICGSGVPSWAGRFGIYSAGYDGFWLHGARRAAGSDKRGIDAASVPVERRARRANRFDLEQPDSDAAGARARPDGA